MSIKDLLVAESKNLQFDIKALDSLFENVQIDESLKESTLTIFEAEIKTRAIALAENHINSLIEKADILMESKVAVMSEELEANFNNYMEFVSKQFIEENKLAITNSLKVEEYDKLINSMKNLFVEYNIVVPEEQVDVLGELEENITEYKAINNQLLEENKQLKNAINKGEKDAIIEKYTANLTESTKEKILDLSEALDFNDRFEKRLKDIVEAFGKEKDSEPESDEDKAKREEAERKAKKDKDGDKKPNENNNDKKGITEGKEDPLNYKPEPDANQNQLQQTGVQSALNALKSQANLG